MKKIDNFKPLLAASSVGLVFGISIAIGSIFGYWLDKKFETKPYLTVFFMLIGIAAGVKNAWHFIKLSGALEEEQPSSSDKLDE